MARKRRMRKAGLLGGPKVSTPVVPVVEKIVAPPAVESPQVEEAVVEEAPKSTKTKKSWFKKKETTEE